MKPNIILFISGKASSGKDTFVNQLRLQLYHDSHRCNIGYEEQYMFLKYGSQLDINKFELEDKKIIRLSFAEEVKLELCRVNPSIDFNRLMTDSAYKEQYRKEMIEIGDGYRSKFHKMIWIEKLDEHLRLVNCRNSGKIIVIPDCRYINEFNYAHDLCKTLPNTIVLTYRINASLPTRLSRMSKAGILNYLAKGRFNTGETELDEEIYFDKIIDNDINLKGPDIMINPASDIITISKTIEA